MKPFGLFSVVVRGVVWIVSAGLLTMLLAGDVTLRLDNALYDLNMRYWRYTPSGDVVIVAVDPKSIDALGLWPWPRATHGRLIDQLTDMGVSTVGMNVYFVSPDRIHPEGDRLLAEAIRRHGRVVMPVYANTSKPIEPLEIRMPIPEVKSASASLGQLVVQVNDDGVARIASLYDGIGDEDWPFLALAIYQLDHPQRHDWQQGSGMLLRYAGPPGTFSTFSYIDVLNGNVDPRLLKGKTVLIGVTAGGGADRYVTPGLRADALMTGIEYVANVLESLRRGMLISQLGFAGNFLFGMVALALPLLMYGWPGLRRTWVVAAISVGATLLASLLMLRLDNIWWPPVSVILLIIAGSIVWIALGPRLTRDRNG